MHLSEQELTTQIQYIKQMSLYELKGFLAFGHVGHIYFSNKTLKNALTDKAKSYKVVIKSK